MCNLYRLTKPNHEVAHLFDAIVGQVGNAGMGEVYPGYSGLVVAGGELRSMVWGFPLVLKGKNGQPLKPKPINNARADKLDSFMWRYSFLERRCLIPVSAFAEAEGAKGQRRAPGSRCPVRILSRSPDCGARPRNGGLPTRW